MEIAVHLQGVVLAAAEQAGRHVDMVAVVAQRLDRRAGGDAAVERQAGTSDRPVVGTGRAILEDRPRSTLGVKRAGPLGRRVLGQAHHFQRPRAVGQAADEAAFLQPGDQPVDARFGLQPSASFISSNEGETPVCAEMLVDEEQQLVLFLRQHGPFSPRTADHKIWNKTKTGHMLV